MITKIIILCEIRKVSVLQAEVTEFIKECNLLDVHPTGGAYQQGQVSYELNGPITDAEARVIAEQHGLLGEYLYCTSTLRMKPFEALAEWDLL